MKLKIQAPAIAGVLLLSAVAVTCLAPAASACTTCGGKKKAGTFIGGFGLMGNGTARSWVKLDSAGKPSSLGVTFSETALSGLPAATKSMPMVEHALALPKEAAVTGFSHISLDWNPAGHAPTGIYTKPHFDVHFYLDNQAALNKITATGKDIAVCDKKPAARFIPAGYILPPGTHMPRMGSHAVDPRGPEFGGKPFTQTFIYGYYNGRMNFLEPMIAKSYLETKPNFSTAIKTPAAYPKKGWYPTRYSIRYDKVRKEFTVSLDNLRQRG